MAQALAHGLVRGKAVEAGNIGACARDCAKLLRNTEPHGFRAFDDAAAVAEFADIVVVAVKPYQVEAVVTPVRELLAKKIVVSVAAASRSTITSGCSHPVRPTCRPFPIRLSRSAKESSSANAAIRSRMCSGHASKGCFRNSES